VTLVKDIEQRMRRLHPESERQWGSMTLAQTLAHCTAGLQMATGVIQPKRASFPGNAIGWLIKPLVFRDNKPVRGNSSSVTELFAAEPTECDFERERAELVTAIDRCRLTPHKTAIRHQTVVDDGRRVCVRGIVLLHSP
jgi:hypothetical protein